MFTGAVAIVPPAAPMVVLPSVDAVPATVLGITSGRYYATDWPALCARALGTALEMLLAMLPPSRLATCEP